MKLSFNKRSKILIGIVVVLLVLVLLNIFQKEVRNLFYFISAPIQKVFYKAGERTSNFFSGIIRARDLKNKVDELELKNQDLISQIINLKDIEKENENLRKALDLELQRDFKLSLARIIGKDISQDFILIDKGIEDGISKDMPIITEQKVLVGRVTELYDKFSKVMLISHKESSFDVKILSQNECSGVIKGLGNLKLLVDFIPKDEELSQRDIVVTSAFGGIFPDNLLVGEIKTIRKKDVESFQQAEIDPAFDISQSEDVFVILEF